MTALLATGRGRNASAVSCTTDSVPCFVFAARAPPRVHCLRVKRLIINADDFGLTAGINRAIAEAHLRGVVNSASLMAGGAQWDEAIALARTLPRLSIGCHVDLIHLAPVSAPAQIPTLTSGTTFRPGFMRFARAALRNRLSAAEITCEAAAQMAKLQSAGLALTHFDTHMHTHLFPHVLRPLLAAARMRGIGALRNPFEPGPGFSQVPLRPKLLGRYCAVRAFHSMAGKFRRIVEAEGLVTTDGTVGIVLTGFLNRRRLDALIRRIPQGTWELVTHPGYSDSALRPLSALTASRETELALLTSPETRTRLQECGVELISYRDLVTAATVSGA
jgi:hopanoid biosynthesis associated protein HpnK